MAYIEGPKNDAVEAIFTYHSPTEEDIVKYKAIRDAAKDLAYIIDASCPQSADRTAAIRCISEAVMNANASIARKGVSYR